MKVTLQSQDPSTFSLEQTLPAPVLETSDGRNTQSIHYGQSKERCFYTLLDELGDPASIMLDSSSSEKLSSGVVKHAQNL